VCLDDQGDVGGAQADERLGNGRHHLDVLLLTAADLRHRISAFLRLRQ
jgi:hypothetical protein